MRKQLSVDIIRCDGHGHCAELLPELLTLDDWGYPIAGAGLSIEVPAELERLARRAVRTCPVLALRLAKADSRASDRR
ncbi:MAG: ferredoxin [Frankiales bacterium]|jgi:ferredoxin|nr:ferredoxin [Frankiales bacterium]